MYIDPGSKILITTAVYIGDYLDLHSVELTQIVLKKEKNKFFAEHNQKRR